MDTEVSTLSSVSFCNFPISMILRRITLRGVNFRRSLDVNGFHSLYCFLFGFDLFRHSPVFFFDSIIFLNTFCVTISNCFRIPR